MAVESVETTREEIFQNSGVAYNACPHCGEKLGPWQKVLLAVDRALVCKNCWYRIILDIPGSANSPPRHID